MSGGRLKASSPSALSYNKQNKKGQQKNVGVVVRVEHSINTVMTRTTRVNVHAQLSNAGDNLSASKKRFGIDNFPLFSTIFYLSFFSSSFSVAVRCEAKRENGRRWMEKWLKCVQACHKHECARARTDGRTDGRTAEREKRRPKKLCECRVHVQPAEIVKSSHQPFGSRTIF